MTDDEITIAKKLALCTFKPKSARERFVRKIAYIAEMNPTYELMAEQRQYLRNIADEMRKQLATVKLETETVLA